MPGPQDNKVIVIDGGFATQLSVHVGDRVDGDPLWSARFNATNPNAVVQTHIDFLKAGAHAILTNTYQASVEGYTAHLRLDAAQSVALIKATVRLAHVARSRFLLEAGEQTSAIDIPWIVGSIGPYGAHLHDGSEYTGSYAGQVTKETLKRWHRVRLDAVVAAGVDALAIETIPCLMEAQAMVELLADEYPVVKYWISFQCKDSLHVAHGETFAFAAQSVWDQAKAAAASSGKPTNLVAVGVNCLNPQFITPLFKSLNGGRTADVRLPLVVYPNSGEVYSVDAGWTGKEHCVPLESYVPEWIELGAKVIGGCCRTYARDIERIRTAVQSCCCPGGRPPNA